MDLNENIRIASEQVFKETTTYHEAQAFREGALSQQAKEYWFEEFKRECVVTDEQASDFIESHRRRIGIIGHDPMIFGCDTRRSGKTQSLREIIQGIEEEGVKVVVCGGGESIEELVREAGVNLPEIFKEVSEIREFVRRPEIIMPIRNLQDEDFTLTSCTSRYIPPKEVKPYDRKAFPNKMNNYKSKKRNKR